MEANAKIEARAWFAGALRGRSPALRYGFAAFLCLLAAAVDLAFPIFRAHVPLVSFLVAVSLTAWLAGFRAGLLASTISVLAVRWLAVQPVLFGSTVRTNYIRLFLAGLTLAAISWLIDYGTRTRQSMQNQQERAEGRERRFQAILSSAAHIAGMGSWEYDIEHDRLEWDDETLRIFGITREAFGENLASFLALVHPEDLGALRAAHIKALATHGVTEMKYRILRPDGQVRTIHDRGQVTQQDHGNAIRSTGMVMDVTEQKRIEDALRESEERFRLFMDHSPTVAWMKDDQGRYVYLSQSYMDRLGGTLEQWLGKTDFEVWPAQVAEQYRSNDQAVLSSGLPRTNFENSQLNGEVRHWVNCKFPFQDASGRRYVAGVAVDITEQRTAEMELRASEERWRAVFDNSAVGIALTNERGVFILTNRAYQEMVGYSGEELRSKTFLDLTYEEDRPANVKQARQLWEGKQRQFQYQKRYRRKDGKLIWVRTTVSVAPGTEMTAPFGVAVVEDITERRLLEEQIHRSQRMEAVGRLAGGVAHDFNNMLGVILGHCLTLEEQLPAGGAHWQSVRQIKSAATRSADLTRQLLAFSRQPMLVPKVLDLNAIIGELTSMLGSLIGEDIELVLRRGGKLGYVKADPGQIEQVVMNLVVNARDAMPHGGRVVVETTNAELNGAPGNGVAATPGAYVMLSVSDNGCGIEAESLSHIFEPFYTTKAEGKGTGLGLATVYGIVKQSGGSIAVDSQPGQGTTFKVYLPQVEGRPETIVETCDEASAGGGNETVLLAEDEPWLCEIVRLQLEDAGYTVLEAHNAAEAMDIARKNGNIDLLLTDVLMTGGTNGLQLANSLKCIRPDLKVLFMTGYTADVIDAKGLADLEDKVLQKPFTKTALRRKLRETLGAR